MDTFNYFNYFTDIEEYFWRKRGAHLLVSPLDWASVETWPRAGLPVEAVLSGIDSAIERYQRSWLPRMRGCWSTSTRIWTGNWRLTGAACRPNSWASSKGSTHGSV